MLYNPFHKFIILHLKAIMVFSSLSPVLCVIPVPPTSYLTTPIRRLFPNMMVLMVRNLLLNIQAKFIPD